MIDRLVHHGHLILFEGNSYRMEHALMKQTARQPGAGAESKDSTLNAKRSGSLWHKRTRITLLGRKQWMLLSFLLDKEKKRKLSTCFFRIMGISRSESGEFSFRFWGFSIDKTQLLQIPDMDRQLIILVSMPSRAWVVTDAEYKINGQVFVSMPSRAWVVTQSAF